LIRIKPIFFGCFYNTISHSTSLRSFRSVCKNPKFFLLGLKHIKEKTGSFSVSEAGAKANAICLSIAETAKANGVDFYRYLLKLLTDFPNLDIYPHSEILNQYMPWSKMIQAECGR
jgi:hypothetical protein